MKKIGLLCVLTFALILCACGKTAQEAWTVDTVWEKMQTVEGMPQMMPVPADRCEYLFGVAEADCSQMLIAVCEDSMRADEIWLIETKDTAAAERLEALAAERREQKAEEWRSYAPDQAKVVDESILIRDGRRLVFMISPIAEALKETALHAGE